MRRNRIIWLILYVLSIVFISFYGGVISYGSFAVLTLIPVVSILYIIFVIFRFRIYQKLDGRNPVCNNRSDFYFTLQNESFMIFSSVRVTFYSDYSTITGLDDRTEYELSPRSGIRKQTDLICRYRGEYEVGIRKITVTDPLRLFSISYNNREPLRVRVRPDIVRIDTVRPFTDVVAAAKDSDINATEPDAAVRDYTRDDDRRMIHWKATAATQKLMVRERTGQEKRGVGIIMDPYRADKTPQEYIPVESKMIEVLIALTLYNCSRNVSVGINCGSCYVVRDMADFESFYEQMCMYDFRDDADRTAVFDAAVSAPVITDKKDVYFITHIWDERAYDLTGQLERIGAAVTVYLVNDEAAGGDVSTFAGTVRIPTDADLTEVMNGRAYL